MSDVREWPADAWWTIRHWFRVVYGTADRWWWRTRRRLFGPGPQCTLTLASTVDLWPGQMLVIEPGTSRQEAVRIVHVEGCTILVEAAQSWRWGELAALTHVRLNGRWRP